jgi:hypothetical protein
MGSWEKNYLWAAWSSFHWRQSIGWSRLGNLTTLPWWCGVGSMAMWIWQHGLDNWALQSLWCGKVDLPTWTWQLGTRDFVIWQSGLGNMDLTIGHYGLCDLAEWTCQMSIPYLCFCFLYSWMF